MDGLHKPLPSIGAQRVVGGQLGGGFGHGKSTCQ